MIPNYPGCEKCPLRDCTPVYGSGGTESGILVLGEAPGTNEVAQKKPFVGVSGKLLRKTIEGVGVDPNTVYFTNSVLCHPPENKTPSTTAIVACNARLRAEIQKINPKKILATGGTALTALLAPSKSAAITKYEGQGMWWVNDPEEIIPWEEFSSYSYYLVPTYHPAAVTRDNNLFRDFARDIKKLVDNSEPIPEPDIEMIIPWTADEACIALQLFRNATLLSCDLETTGFSPLQDIILSIGFGALTVDDVGYSLVIPIEVAIVEEVKESIRDLLKNFPGKLIFHNAKFDLQFLQRWLDEDVQPIDLVDTMLMNYALDERGVGGDQGGRGYRVHGLKELARVRYDIPDYHFDFNKWYKLPKVMAKVAYLRGEEYIPEDLDFHSEEWLSLYNYQGKDLYLPIKLYEVLLEEMREESPRLLDLCNDFLFPAMRAFTEIELHGVTVDQPYLRWMKEKTENELANLFGEIDAVCRANGLENFNPNSPKQVKEMFAKLKFFPPNGERETLLLALKQNKYPDSTKKFVHDVMDYRQRSKTLQTYVNGILERLDPDGRVRSDFLLHGADTGRLASRDPNLQNIPILMGADIRNVFVAPGVSIVEGVVDFTGDDASEWTLIEGDYSQLELRIAAFLSQDESMIKVFREGGDIHRNVASDVFEKPEETITKHERYLAKYVDFGVIYGRGPRSLTEGWEAQYIVENLGGRAWTFEQAEAFIDRFLNGKPQLKAWIDLQHKLVRARQYVETATGRRRRFPLLSGSEVGHIERQAVNTPIQSLGNDFDLSALIRLHDIFKYDFPGRAYVLFPVHDSIMFEVHKSAVGEIAPIIKSQMLQPPIEFNVPLAVDLKIGPRWGTMEGLDV